MQMVVRFCALQACGTISCAASSTFVLGLLCTAMFFLSCCAVGRDCVSLCFRSGLLCLVVLSVGTVSRCAVGRDCVSLCCRSRLCRVVLSVGIVVVTYSAADRVLYTWDLACSMQEA